MSSIESLYNLHSQIGGLIGQLKMDTGASVIAFGLGGSYYTSQNQVELTTIVFDTTQGLGNYTVPASSTNRFDPFYQKFIDNLLYSIVLPGTYNEAPLLNALIKDSKSLDFQWAWNNNFRTLKFNEPIIVSKYLKQYS